MSPVSRVCRATPACPKLRLADGESKWIPPRCPMGEALTQEVQKALRAVLECWEDLLQVAVADVAVDRLAEHLPEVGSERKVAALVELLRPEPRPAAIHASAFYRSAQDKHYVGVAVIGTAIAVF